MSRHIATADEGARHRQHLGGKQIEHRLRVRMIAAGRGIPTHEDHVLDPKHRRTQQIRLQRNAIAVARRHLQDRLDAMIQEKVCDRFWLDRHPRPRRLREIECIHPRLEELRLGDDVGEVGALGRRQLAGDYKAARPDLVLEFAHELTTASLLTKY